jgi:hypothetical protein
LPPEAIETQDEVHVGYVLEDDVQGGLVLLGHVDRRVTRIAATDVAARSFCEIRSSGPNWFSRAFDTPLIGLLRKTADYPQCPE